MHKEKEERRNGDGEREMAAWAQKLLKDVLCKRCHLMGHIEKFCKESQQQGRAHATV